MPFDIQPIGAAHEAADFSIPSPAVDWLTKQPFSVTQAWQNIGEHRAGGSLGGPTDAVRSIVTDPHQFAIAAQAPPIVQPVATKQAAFGKFGNVTINEIDPSASFASALAGFGVNPSDAAAAVRGTQGFFDQRGIDLANAPSRLLDYSLGWIGASIDLATGKPISIPVAKPDSQITYKFQSDPSYFPMVARLDDSQLHEVAVRIAGQYVAGGDSYLAQQLESQMKLDRDRALGFSSGDARQDYLAKLAFTADYIDQAQGGKIVGRIFSKGGAATVRSDRAAAIPAALAIWPAAVVSALPVVGTDLAQLEYRHPQQIEDAWRKLSDQQRADYFGRIGAPSLVGDAAVWIPLLGGLGAVEATAMKAGGIAAKSFQAYNGLLRVMNAGMAVGVTVATVNWGLEAAIPAYAASIGKRIDYARPFSGSDLAGAVNLVGYFSSGTFGVNLAARGALRVGGKVLEAVHVPLPGIPEVPLFKFGMGGSAVVRELTATGLPNAGVLELAPKQTFLSWLTNLREADQRLGLEAWIRGESTGVAELDAMATEGRLEYANQALMRGVEQRGAIIEGDVKLMAEADRPAPLNSPEKAAAHGRAVSISRYLHDTVAKNYLATYGPEWLTRLTGSYTVKDMEAYARRTVTRLGGDATKLGSHNEEGWAQVIRSLHAYEYTSQNAVLHAVAAGTEEAPRLLMMQSDHVFANEVDGALAVLRGTDPGQAAALSAQIVRTKQEAADWFANRWKPDKGVARTPENVPPAELADWLESVKPALPSKRMLPDPTSSTAGEPLNAFHAQIERDGNWTLGFKPLDEAGTPISYIRRADGSVFKSPWVDYPLGSEANIQMGNRGLLLSKLDGAFRGFRTWRIAEFQKALLFRRLSGRYDVQAAQIDRFYDGVLALSRKHGVQAQTLGAAARAAMPMPGVTDWANEINALAKEVFGAAELPLKAGGSVKVDWAEEVAKSFQQSLRLNATAGLTSHLKANLGEAGSQIAWLSDVGYVAFRFNLSPVFKGGELVESAQLNLMRGVRGVDDQARALYARIGVGNDYSAYNGEKLWDPMLVSLSAKGEAPSTVSSRNALSMAFNARSLPEDLTLKMKTATTQGAAADFRGVHDGGNLPSPDMLPAYGEGAVVRATEIPPDFTIDAASFPAAKNWYDPGSPPEERSLWHATPAIDKVMAEGLRPGTETGALGLGPGVRQADRRQISITGRWGVAHEIGERLRLAIRASRNEASIAEILDHFEAPERYAGDLQAIVKALRDAHPDLKVIQGWNTLSKYLERTYRSGAGKYQLVQDLDRGLLDVAGEDIVHVGLTADAGAMAKLDPEQIGIVQVAARKGAPAEAGQDAFELRFNKEDLRVIDDRNPLPPLADTEEGLLAQFHETLAQQPKPGQITMVDALVGGNGIVPGLETRARQILTKLEDIQAAKVDAGPAFEWATRTPEVQAAFRQQLEADGWKTIDTAGTEQALYDQVVGRRYPNVKPGVPTKITARLLDDAEEGWFRRQFAPFIKGDTFTLPAERPGGSIIASPADVVQRTRLDGTVETRPIADLYDQSQRQMGSATDLAHTAGTAEALFTEVETAAAAAAKAGGPEASAWRRFRSDLAHPARFKTQKMTDLEISLMRRQFPSLLRLSGNDGVIKVYRSLGVPEARWLDHLIEDRRLLDRFMGSNSQADLQKLIEHAGGDANAATFAALYNSEDWAVLSTLISTNLRVASEEAFGTHFFSAYRSAFERTINHPLLGIYPASWTIKISREWAKFLFDNNTLGLRLGMAPAQAIARIVQAQKAGLAIAGGDSSSDYLSAQGPLGSAMLIFNLLLPGDWSGLPFPASRTIRDISRPLLAKGTLPPMGDVVKSNLENMGLGRDLRLFFETLGQAGDLLAPKDTTPAARAKKPYSVTGVEPSLNLDTTR